MRQRTCRNTCHNASVKTRKEERRDGSGKTPKHNEALNVRRQETVDNLAFEFGVAARTIRYDIERLSLCYPVYTKTGPGGGVYVTEDFRLRRMRSNEEQRELLERLCSGLTGRDGKAMKSIIRMFPQTGRERPMTEKEVMADLKDIRYYYSRKSVLDGVLGTQQSSAADKGVAIR